MYVHQAASEAKPLIGAVPEENISIAERLQAHDPEILDELILRYQTRLRGYLTRLTADRELSEDLL
jgi:hypothetical protein